LTTQAAHVRGESGALTRGQQRGLFELPRRREFLARHLGGEPRRVLDVGCAGGLIALMLQRLGHRVAAVELNGPMAREARRRGVDVVQQDLERALPFRSCSFDAVHACEIIEHLYDTKGFLEEVNRVLVPGGVLVISTPNLNSLGNRLRVLAGRSLPMWGAHPGDLHGSHVRVLNAASIRRLLEGAGFRVDRIEGVDLGRLGAAVLRPWPTLSHLLLLKCTKVA